MIPDLSLGGTRKPETFAAKQVKPRLPARGKDRPPTVLALALISGCNGGCMVSNEAENQRRADALVTVRKGPSLEDWRRLALVCRRVPDLIEDEATPTTGGLLGLLSPMEGGSQASIFKRSRFGGAIFRRVSRESMGPHDLDAELLAILPAADNLGGSRDERLANLRQVLRSLPAYAWLTSQRHAFPDVMSTLSGGKIGAAYSSDIADLKLWAATGMHLGLCLNLAGMAKFPTKAQVRGAVKAARALQKFLREHDVLLYGGKVSFHTWGGIGNAVAELEAFSKVYKKKPDSVTGLFMQTKDLLISATLTEFGESSPTLISELLRLVGYEGDVSNVRKTANRHKAPKIPTVARTWLSGLPQ